MTQSFRQTLVFAVIAALTAVPAQACRVGGDRILFETRPKPVGLANVEVIHVQFTNVGRDYNSARSRLPFFDHNRALIGVAKLLRPGPASQGYFPVYATATSCTHGFFSNAYSKEVKVKHIGEFFMVGRFEKTKAGLKFDAGGDWNGRWHW